MYDLIAYKRHGLNGVMDVAVDSSVPCVVFEFVLMPSLPSMREEEDQPHEVVKKRKHRKNYHLEPTPYTPRVE